METNFAALTPDQKLVWSKDIWKAAREQAFTTRFLGKGPTAMIQRVTELTKTEKGEECIFHLLADLVEDGVVNDNEREGMEESMQSYPQKIGIGLMSHGVKSKGKLSEQKTVVEFRKNGKDLLSYWLANRIDQLAFLTLSGVSYAYMNNGKPRASSAFLDLEFANDVSAPTANRHVNWNGSSLEAGDTTAITSSYTPGYKMIVDLIAYAKDHYIKPLLSGGKEYYVLLVKPGTLAAFKKDPDYQRAVVTALPRNAKNPFFTGGTVTIDGAVLHEHRMVFNTVGAASGSKWGPGGVVDGSRTLLCGAQALAMSDLGPPEWCEKMFQYNSKGGLNIDKMLGFLKPKFHSIYDDSEEDFGALACDHYLG